MPKAVSVETMSNEIYRVSVTVHFHMSLGFGSEPVCLGDYIRDAHRDSLFFLQRMNRCLLFEKGATLAALLH